MLNKRLYSTSECAKILGISRITVFNWIKAKKLIAVKQAGIYLIPQHEIDKLQEAGHLHSNDKKILRAFTHKLITDYSDVLFSIG